MKNVAQTVIELRRVDFMKKNYLPDGYKPTVKEALEYNKKAFSANPNVGNAKEETIVKLCRKSIHQNETLEDVLSKCVVINTLANTNIIEVFHVAKHIFELHIDSRLQAGDYSLVKDIAEVEIKDKPHRFYSFASKYCSYHYPEKFSIYDRYVDLMLFEFQKRDHFGNFNRQDLKNYACYMKALHDFKSYYKLEDLTMRELDKYLWLLGKECVQNQSK